MGNPSTSGHSDGLTLSVHPSVVFRLGEEMIQDDVQAIVELAKNAYDADSATARIVVDTQAWTAADGTPADPVDSNPGALLQGTIEVRDRGTGMTRDEIVQSWLTVSGSQKREQKAKGQRTAKNRTPVGDKGLGRLGTQRLGRVLDLYTVVRGSGTAHRLTIPWEEYASAERLDSVTFALLSEPAPPSDHGTTLTIRGLRNPDHWRGNSVQNLERRLSAMISPFRNRGFSVSLNIDGRQIDLLERPDAVRANAMVRYKLDYRDQILAVAGTVTQDYFRPDRGGADKRTMYERAIGADNGTNFLNWLLAKKKEQVTSLRVRADPDRYIAFDGRFALSDIDGIPRDHDQPVDPGAFSGEVDMVRLRDDIPSVFDSSADYSDFVKEINGIRIYRDGFGIPVSKDWLNLAARWTSGSSFYNLRPENIIGFIDLTAADNPGLEETSSREQFRDTPAYRSFLTIMERWRKFTENAQTFLRRSYNEYQNELAVVDANIGTDSTPTVLIERSDKQAAQATQLLTNLKQARRSAESALAAAKRQEQSVGESLFPEGTNQLRQAAYEITGVLSSIDELATNVDALRASYAQQRNALVALREQFDAVQAQLAEAWETVALGLTAEALSHEVSHVTERLRQRTQALLRGLKEPISEVAVRTYAEHVMSSTTALTRQLAHLNPALRYRREQRQRVVMSSAAQDIASHFNNRWKDLSYNIDVTVAVKRDFAVRISPGRLTQVLDNLILNSEYWLQSQGSTDHRSVSIAIDAPRVTVSDSGPGVEPALEGLIFDPFVSGKGKNGRGLGLFVAQQLLEPEGASVGLSHKRGPDGRRRDFVIEFEPSRTEQPA